MLVSRGFPIFCFKYLSALANHIAEEFQEYFDYLWALYESLSVQGYTILMGDFNCDLGNSMGDRAPYEPNQRGLKLSEFANYFNLLSSKSFKTMLWTVYTYHSCCGRYRSTIGYIFLPNCLFKSIVSVKTLEPITSQCRLPLSSLIYLSKSLAVLTMQNLPLKIRSFGPNFRMKRSVKSMSIRFCLDLEYFELEFCDSVSVTENLTSLIVHHSCSLKAHKTAQI